MKRAIIVCVLVLLSGVAVAGVFGGSGSGGAGAVVDVLSELVGKPVVASSYRATTAQGPGFFADGVLSCVLDLGAGPRNCLGTNVSGDILLGPDDGGAGTHVRIAGDVTAISATLVNGGLNLLNNAVIYNGQPGKPVAIQEEEGFRVNDGTPLKGEYALKGNVIDFPMVSNGSCSSLDYALPGAKVGDLVGVQAEFEFGDDAPDVTVRGGRVPVDGTVRIRFCNSSPMTEENPPSGPYTIYLRRY